MSEMEENDIYAVWQQLRQRNDWNLVEDEAVFLASAAAELSVLSDDTPQRQRLFIAIQRAYSMVLYRGLWHHDERAVQELWLSLLRLAIKRDWSQNDAEELAQEVIARLLEKLHNLRAPQSFLIWALQIFRTVERDKRKEDRITSSPQNNDNPSDLDPVDPLDIIKKVEQRMINQELQAQLNAKLSNELERLVLIRVVLFGDNPRDVAHDLGIPLHRTRIAKHRALNRLREDSAFVQLLYDKE